MSPERKMPAWECTPNDRGYFCVRDDVGPLVQGEVIRGRCPEIHVGADQPVVLDKLFGPLAYQCVRVTADLDSGDWVIERETRDGWERVARFAGQTAEYFGDDDE